MAAAAAGTRVDDLTLAECLSYDPRPQKGRGRQRFLCCRHGGDHQKSLSVADETGKFNCFTCHIWGTVVEHQQNRSTAGGWGRSSAGWGQRPAPLPPLPEAAPLVENIRAVQRAVGAWKAFAGSPAEAYAARRGISVDLARALRLGYWKGLWREENSEWLTFPLRCPVTGKPVGVYGRNLHSDDKDRKARVLGPRGLFGSAVPGPLPDDVILVEGAFEALAILANPELPPARAVIGASARAEWFDHCRRLVILFDDDPPGREATDRLVEDLNHRRLRRQCGPRVLCLKPESLRKQYDCKDLGELLQRGVRIELDLPPLETTAPISPAGEMVSSIPSPVEQKPVVGVWDEPAAWARIQAAVQTLPDLLPPTCIDFAELFAPELLEATDAAEAAIETAYAEQDAAALDRALSAFHAAHQALAAGWYNCDGGHEPCATLKPSSGAGTEVGPPVGNQSLAIF